MNDNPTDHDFVKDYPVMPVYVTFIEIRNSGQGGTEALCSVPLFTLPQKFDRIKIEVNGTVRKFIVGTISWYIAAHSTATSVDIYLIPADEKDVTMDPDDVDTPPVVKMLSKIIPFRRE